MFIDEAEIEVIAGKGGNGSASFRREKFIPRGGPDGGDGGEGGHVFLRIKENIHGLSGLEANKVFRAPSGESGRGKQQTGARGESLQIDVPPGTLVYQVDQRPETRDQSKLVIDMAAITPGELYRIARGGHGGWGNLHFANSVNQAPRQFTPGVPGEHKRLKLVVSHIADVGLVGLPNVGKSTFLARVSAARPKVANYPFTTLEPYLGVVEVDATRFVIADIPGLIEGAAEGKGLGHQFLKHLKRTHVLLHLIDAQSADPIADYHTIRRELEAYEQDFLRKPEVIAVSRADTLDETGKARIRQLLEPTLGSVLMLSSQSGQGVDALLHLLSSRVRSDQDGVQPLDKPAQSS